MLAHRIKLGGAGVMLPQKFDALRWLLRPFVGLKHYSLSFMFIGPAVTGSVGPAPPALLSKCIAVCIYLYHASWHTHSVGLQVIWLHSTQMETENKYRLNLVNVPHLLPLVTHCHTPLLENVEHCGGKPEQADTVLAN